MFQKILIAYDGSETGKRALGVALSLAGHYSGELDLLSVMPPLPGYASQRQKKPTSRTEENDAYFRRLQREATVAADEAHVLLHPHVAQGHEAEAVIKFIKEHPTDLLIIGQVGHASLFRRVWGGTAQALARLAPCNVLVVK